MKAEQLLQQVKAGELKAEEFFEQPRALPTAEAEKLLDLLLDPVAGESAFDAGQVEDRARDAEVRGVVDPDPVRGLGGEAREVGGVGLHRVC